MSSDDNTTTSKTTVTPSPVSTPAELAKEDKTPDVRRSETQIRTTVTAIDVTQTLAVVGFLVLYGLALFSSNPVPTILDNALLVIVTAIVSKRMPQ